MMEIFNIRRSTLRLAVEQYPCQAQQAGTVAKFMIPRDKRRQPGVKCRKLSKAVSTHGETNDRQQAERDPVGSTTWLEGECPVSSSARSASSASVPSVRRLLAGQQRVRRYPSRSAKSPRARPFAVSPAPEHSSRCRPILQSESVAQNHESRSPSAR